MRVLVQKFGGTSLCNDQIRDRAVQHVKMALEEGYHVVVVVSAMGRMGEPYATDTLLSLLVDKSQITPQEMDLFVSCGEVLSSVVFSNLLKSEGIPAIALTGKQAGIITNEEYGQAQILTVKPERILEEFEQGRVVVVCGFQGATHDGEVTTLGRGGSDTSATALGAALHAEFVDIFTDVNGIMTADPRIVEEASALHCVTYNEICNLAYQGAKVIHPRAVEIAMQHQVPIRVRSTMHDHVGTLVTSAYQKEGLEGSLHDRLITGITQVPHITQIKVFAKDGDYDLQLKVFKAMAENKISVDFINVNPKGVAYTVLDEDTDKAISILTDIGYDPLVQTRCAKVSAVGAGIAGVPGVMAKIVEALTDEDIQILQAADSHTTIWVLVKEEQMVRAVKALHRKFDLHRLNEACD